MAYRSYLPRRTKRRYPARALRGRRRSRRSTVKKRTYRRRTRRPRGRKMILNITSRKKRDTMISSTKRPFTDPDFSPGNIVFSPQTDGVRLAFGFCCTARAINANLDAGEANVNDDATRTATRCFWKGFADNIQYQTNTGHMFLHRRIVFSFYGEEILRRESDGDIARLYALTDDGYVRAMTALHPSSVGGDDEIYDNLTTILFLGQEDVDWTDELTAPVDKRRVRLMHDSTYKIQSGNANGIIKDRRLYHSMGRTLIYNDDEAGGGKVAADLSANLRSSMGDVYILDFFKAAPSPAGGETPAPTLTLTMQGSAYWHER